MLGCDVAFADTTPARAFNFGLRPVEIAASASGAPDTINVLYGDSSFYGAEGSFTDATATTKKLRRRGGFKRGDLAVVAVNAGASAATANCQLVEINQDDDPDGYTVGHTTDPYKSFYAGRRRRRSRRASTARLRTVLHRGNDVQPRPAAAPRRLEHPGRTGS